MRLVTPNATDFTNVTAGSAIATLMIPQSQRRLVQLDLIYKLDGTRATQTEIETDIEYIEFKLLGNVQRKIYPEKLFLLEALKGQTFSAGRIPIRFSQPERRSALGEDSTALVLDEIGGVTINVKLAAQATARTLEARLVTEPIPNNAKRPQQEAIVTYTEKQVQLSGAGEKRDTYVTPSGRGISMVHAFSADITAMRVMLGELILWDFADKETLDDLLVDNGYVPQDDVWSFGGELLTSRLADVLMTGNQTLKFEFTIGAAPGSSFDMLFEELGRAKV
ncbi:major capsid protein P2 [Kordiimonas sp.]|uniref:major capsid protein P2 n=1 Tax=Kordiimonas sp. TaxID=1970157 RepID=UPI003B526961